MERADEASLTLMSKLAMFVPWALERATKKLALLFASPFSPMAEVTAKIEPDMGETAMLTTHLLQRPSDVVIEAGSNR